MLKRLVCRKDALNYNRIKFFNSHNQLPRNAILLNAKLIANSIWKRYSENDVVRTFNT